MLLMCEHITQWSPSAMWTRQQQNREPNADSMLVLRLRRRPNIETALGRRFCYWCVNITYWDHVVYCLSSRQKQTPQEKADSSNSLCYVSIYNNVRIWSEVNNGTYHNILLEYGKQIFNFVSICSNLQRMMLLNVKPYSAGTDFKRQNLTSVDVRFWRLKSVPTLKE